MKTASYSYLPGGQTQEGYTSTTPLVSAIAQDGVSFSYGYAADSNNTVSENRTGGSYAGETTYEYDTLVFLRNGGSYAL